jgi:serine/threonine protein kinase
MYNNTPKVIGEGSYGCVHKPSLTCKDKTVNYNGKVSKYMNNRAARTEMKEYSAIQNIDKDADYYMGHPIYCKVDETNPININAIRECEEGKEILNENKMVENNTLLIMKDGGLDLHEFVKKYKDEEKTQELQEKIEKFWMECHRLLKGLRVFINNQFVHHDIKPQNIMYNESENRLNYIDFGVSQNMKNIIETSNANSYIRAKFWWNYPPEMRFYHKKEYMEFFTKSDDDKSELYLNYLNSYNTNRNVNMPSTFSNTFKMLFGYIENPKTVEKQLKTKFFEDLEEFFINDSYTKRNYMEFLGDSTITIDIYGLGVSLMYVLTNTPHLIDNNLFEELYDIFYKMMHPNLLERYDIDVLIQDYEFILNKTGVLQKYGKHFENNELVNRKENKLNNDIKSVIQVIEKTPINLDPDALNRLFREPPEESATKMDMSVEKVHSDVRRMSKSKKSKGVYKATRRYGVKKTLKSTRA